MDRIGDTFHGLQVFPEDRDAEADARIVVVCPRQPGKQPGQRRPTQNACDAPQGLASRGRGRNSFGHVIKNIRFHLCFFLPSFVCVSNHPWLL
jgi:hypothetical protein